jgi:hypothetical protein
MSAHQHRNCATSRVGVDLNSGEPGWTTLIPAASIAYGAVEEPVERLMGLQCAIGRAVGWMADIGLFLSSLPRVRISEVFSVASFMTDPSAASQRKS